MPLTEARLSRPQRNLDRMPIIRTVSPLPGPDFLRRLNSIGLGQRTFARRAGISYQQVHRYVSGKLPVPAFIHRLLLGEEMLRAATLLTRTEKTRRVSKLELRSIIKSMSEPITTKPQKRKEKPHKFKRNFLSPRYLLVPPPPPPTDELDRAETWAALASRIGPDAAAELHRKLAARRPAGPRRHPADGDPPPSRNSDPI